MLVRQRHSFAEYLDLEVISPVKHEHLDGHVWAIEVLSPSTENYDRGEKLAHYKQIPSVREILLIAHEEHRLELWRRTDTGWTLEVARAGPDDRVSLSSLDCTLELAEIYRNPLGR